MKPKNPLFFSVPVPSCARWGRGLRVWFAGLLAGWALVASHLAAAASPDGIHVSTLSNGMSLIVKPDRRAPTAVHMLWVRVGSTDEVDGTSGVAHVLEHMMFKGTPTVPEGEFSRRVAALGGRENAFTGRDMTAYHQQVPAHRLEEVMRLEADRFAHNQWSDDAFKREIEVIKEERRQRVEDSPPARLFEAYGAVAWMAHPYRRPVIGWMSDLDAMTPDDARDFFRRWYVPANAAVVVVGDVDVAQVTEWAERYYGAVPQRVVPARKPQVEPAQTGARRLEFRARAKQPLLVLGYRAPRLSTPDDDSPAARDALALLLLAQVLDGHSAARLSQSLVQRQRLADSVDASFGVMARGPQLFSLSATPAEGVSPTALEAALKAEILRVAEQGVSEAELKRVKNQWAASEVFKLDSQMGQAQELGQLWVQGWPPGGRQQLLARLKSVTPDQIKSVAARYFKDDQMTVGLLLPEEAP
jgi:zinc protease